MGLFRTLYLNPNIDKKTWRSLKSFKKKTRMLQKKPTDYDKSKRESMMRTVITTKWCKESWEVTRIKFTDLSESKTFMRLNDRTSMIHINSSTNATKTFKSVWRTGWEIYEGIRCPTWTTNRKKWTSDLSIKFSSACQTWERSTKRRKG